MLLARKAGLVAPSLRTQDSSQSLSSSPTQLCEDLKSGSCTRGGCNRGKTPRFSTRGKEQAGNLLGRSVLLIKTPCPQGRNWLLISWRSPAYSWGKRPPRSASIFVSMVQAGSDQPWPWRCWGRMEPGLASPLGDPELRQWGPDPLSPFDKGQGGRSLRCFVCD